MVDVGRNYQSVKQLKQQIDVMAAYKLNVFHFHLTEDIAWRLQSKLYPQLTDAKNMLRNPGEFYSLDEMKELIAYCKERYITLVPEIDMPGHSAAFTRAMGVDMQSEKGMEICKNILTELCAELDVPLIHIGGDEVKITNKEFLPAMVSTLKALNKKVIAWDPGGNVPEGTILQMWNGNIVPKKKFPAVDSRHLYLNHFDPIDGVAAIFNHQVCDVQSGNENNLGATLCNWPDRRVSKEEDLINMNAVYPVMLTFAERCWQGGGWKNFLSDIGTPGAERFNAFVEFENRLLEHKALNFKNISFPYVKQSDIEWKLIGPFDNKGKTESSFAPESKKLFDTVQLKNYSSVYGGTIWLRHFWHPMIQSHLQNPEDSTTWYAVRKIWSDEEGEKKFWIGFNNLSRSPATDSPPMNAWDNKGSSVWVNGNLVEPPKWKHAGQKGNSEIPLFDEGYEYREPTKIYLQKGWNTVLIKAPVGTFKGEWQNPVKWMFTFVQL
jgi:hexosaminidase